MYLVILLARITLVYLYIPTKFRPSTSDIPQVGEHPSEMTREELRDLDYRGVMCGCWYHCRNREEYVGTYYEVCERNHSVYYECNNENSCKTKKCPPNQIFNTDSSTCEYCPIGEHKNKRGTYCTCNEGTKFDKIYSKCIPCPTGAIIYDSETCFCKYDEVHDKVENVCKKCPAGTHEDSGTCKCRNPQLFWSSYNFSCHECPGDLIKRKNEEYFCHCRVENQVFNEYSATCVTCPPTSVFKYNPGVHQFCECPEGERYFDQLNTCIKF